MEDKPEYFFDKKLKSKFEEVDIPFKEEDWALLEPKLEKERKRYLLKKFGIPVLVVVAVFSCLGLVYKFSTMNSFSEFTPGTKNNTLSEEKNIDKRRDSILKVNNPKDPKIGNHPLPEKTLGKGSSEVNDLSLNRGALLKKPGLIKDKNLKSEDSNKILSINTHSLAHKNKAILKSTLAEITTSRSSSLNLQNKEQHRGRFIPKEIGQSSNSTKYSMIKDEKELAIENSPNNKIEALDSKGKKSLFPNLDSLITGQKGLRMPVYQVESNIKVNDFVNTKRRKKPRELKLDKPNNYWSLAGLVAPDFNSVNSLQPSGVGINVGVELGYILSDRWKLSAGVIYGPKIYQASSEQYQNSTFPSYWNNLQSINANCKVFDIPIELGYSFYKKDRSQFFVNLGVSTYFMHQETYTINYPPWTLNSSGGQQNSYSYNIYNQNKNLLGVADLVLDYHYRLTDRASFGLSPYLKLPFTGVGQGNLNLISFGTSLSINYNFGKNP